MDNIEIGAFFKHKSAFIVKDDDIKYFLNGINFSFREDNFIFYNKDLFKVFEFFVDAKLAKYFKELIKNNACPISFMPLSVDDMFKNYGDAIYFEVLDKNKNIKNIIKKNLI